ncbi:hypothetical protein [Lactiplantibacillus paraxiangfangensis]|uniref:hypothetical protein n=1 Tax=Lactiplantibacillus paraxiangfangensis TaxID=3076224 RepID=UPI0030C7290D
MTRCLTPISDRAVKAYLDSDDINVIKWISYMAGTLNLNSDDVANLTIPELSVMVYCTRKRIKNEQESRRSIFG